MKALIDAGADITAKPEHGRSILAEAASANSPDGVSLLLKAGAIPNEEALGIAAWLNRTETVKTLLEAGVPPQAGLARAAQGGHVDLVRQLLKAGAKANATPKGQPSPLHLAALQGGLETVALLLAHQADPNAVDERGQTPLHMAIAGDGDIRGVKRLVSAGGRLNVADNEGVTPVRLAGIRGQKPTYDWLVQANQGREPVPDKSQQLQKEAPSIPDLIADVPSKDRNKSQAARRNLVLLGTDAVSAIVKAIESGADIEPFYEIFSNMGPAAEGALPLLKSKLTDKEQVLSAILTMQRMGPDVVNGLDDQTKQKAASTLYDFIVDPKADVMAGFAFRMLMVLGEPAEDAIVRLLQHPSAQVRKQSARNLQSSPFATKRLADALLHLTETDPDLEVRAAAADTLRVMNRHNREC